MANQPFDSHFGNSNGNDGIDPSELTIQGGGFMNYPFGSQQNLSASFNLGNSGIDTDELLDLDLNGQNGMNRGDMNYYTDQRQTPGLSMSHQSQMTPLYSQTPDGAPIQSPYINGSFNFDQYQSIGQHSLGTPSHMQHMHSPFEQGMMSTKVRPTLQVADRSNSDIRSPLTPKTPGIGGLTLGTPDSGSFPTQPIRTGLQHRHQKTLSNQWDGTPGSAQSFGEVALSSPGLHSHHANMAEMLKSGKHASLPTKVTTDVQTTQSLESQEAKRRRRRASHNLVERRRRDNINERIQDLSHLVPQHRLEDDKVRKQLLNNSALSPNGTSNMSPPSATSLLAGGSGRRATAANITMGLPLDDKEKGPNKGDILNGAVGWMRDLMWALHVKMQQESELAELISNLGGTWPFEQTEEEKRMRTELLDAMDKNDPNTFTYSRAPGSGLRVPKHTNISGESMQSNGGLSPDSLSPANASGANQPQYWSSSGHAGLSFKEEDEYSMEIN
jgi:hypothetical protein